MNPLRALNNSPVWQHLSTSESAYVSVWKAQSAECGELFCSVVQFECSDEASCAVVLMPRGALVMAETVTDIEHGMALCDRFVDRQMAAT